RRAGGDEAEKAEPRVPAAAGEGRRNREGVAAVAEGANQQPGRQTRVVARGRDQADAHHDVAHGDRAYRDIARWALRNGQAGQAAEELRRDDRRRAEEDQPGAKQLAAEPGRAVDNTPATHSRPHHLITVGRSWAIASGCSVGGTPSASSRVWPPVST